MTCRDASARPRRSAAALVALGLAAALFAGGPAVSFSGQDDLLTLEEAIGLALERNEDALATRETVTASQARLARARSAFLPTLSATGVYTRRPFEVKRTVADSQITIQNFNALSGVAALNMTLFDADNIPSLNAARSERSAQELSASESRRQLAFQVTEAYLRTIVTDQVLEASRRRFDFARQNLEAAKARFAAGLASVNDVTRAELEFATAEMGVIQVEGEGKTARLDLAHLLDAPEAAVRTLAAPEFLLRAAEETPVEPEALVADARDRRPDLGARRWNARAQHALTLEPTLRWLPSLTLNGQYRYTNEAGLTGRTLNWNVGLTLNWSLFDGLARNADFSERKALARLADLDVQASERRIELEVREALVSLDNQRAALKQAGVARDIARRNAAETTELYRQGLASALEVADASVRLFEAEVELVGERYNLGLAFLDFEAASGLDPFGKEPVR